MMSLGFFTVLAALVMVALIFWLLRRDRLPIMHSLWWLGVAALMLVLGFYPGLIDRAAVFVGISYPPSLLFVVGILVLFIKVLLEDVGVSHDRRRMIDLVQKVGMLEEELNQLKQKHTASTDRSDQHNPPES